MIAGGTPPTSRTSQRVANVRGDPNNANSATTTASHTEMIALRLRQIWRTCARRKTP